MRDTDHEQTGRALIVPEGQEGGTAGLAAVGRAAVKQGIQTALFACDPAMVIAPKMRQSNAGTGCTSAVAAAAVTVTADAALCVAHPMHGKHQL